MLAFGRLSSGRRRGEGLDKATTLNITARQQAVRAVHRPKSVRDVVELVRQAHQGRRRLYPVSTGLNWGYGSGSPVMPDCELVDLSEMDRIRNEPGRDDGEPGVRPYSANNPVALIEPGVTQGQLYDSLQRHCPALTFNVTGSARGTSLLGNALDRGVGYLGPRREDLFALEVVTGTGQVLRTGFRRLGEGSPLAHTHPYGLGPMLDGLFFQGNFGIVTSACFRLLPQPPCRVAVSLALRRPEDLPRLIDGLAALKREGVMSSVTHIGNRVRTQASMMSGISGYLAEHCGLAGAELEMQAQAALLRVAPYEWASLGGVSGTKGQVRAAIAEVRSRLGGLARITLVDDAKLALGYGLLHRLRFLPFARANAAAIAAIRPLHGLASGVPTDAAIDNLTWRFGAAGLPATQLDQTNCGLLFINPALPMDGAFAAATVEAMKTVAQGFGHELYVTLNIETPSSLVAVANLLFDRSKPDAVARALRCADALYECIRRRGLEVYRARADMMEQVVRSGDPFWETLRSLKSVLDPHDVIAPGRYNLPLFSTP
ncbi:FAD-binding oxidoreductase [Roseateles sp. DAIF2]|uniref:FAD-binding oxidoreductase n=1 Tax=Roseateles sp. DAIF2 TaxID=2714952 RepID=UPI0018A2D9CB|nr:FAD-binding protein [Roseateles sp. DAIF2]QPF73685.1 FAD-binding oxidoreductase [Roseateles sp. DAIF2]